MPKTTISGTNLKTTSLGLVPRRIFDPNKIEDLKDYKYFITKGSWKGGLCPFQLQWPYLNIPTMLHEMVAQHYVTKVLKFK